MPDADANAVAPLIVLGAFDRHNFGDMLFAHVVGEIVAAHRPDIAPVFAGLAARDLRDTGGHDVIALADAIARWRDAPVTLVHAGGELLTCDAWEAAVMLADPADAQAQIARHGGSADDRRAWARATLRTHARAPYVIGRETFPNAAWIDANAIGGATLAARDAAFRAEVFDKLRNTDSIAVRDRDTQATLSAAGIAARLVPDPVSLVASMFGERIRAQACRGEVADVRRRYHRGYVAVQFSADFGDDATLADIARQLDALGTSAGIGIVLFRAGAAPWHDDIDVYERVAARIRHADVALFASLDAWDICALVASSAGFAGSSLHGRIVAMAHGLPCVNVHRPDDAGSAAKQRAYVAAWENADAPGVVPVAHLADAMSAAFARDRDAMHRRAMWLAQASASGFQPLLDGLR